MKDDKIQINVDASQYLKVKKNFPEEYYDVDPVDMNGAFVPFDKFDKDNLDEVQENVRQRFQMDSAFPETETKGGE